MRFAFCPLIALVGVFLVASLWSCTPTGYSKLRDPNLVEQDQDKDTNISLENMLRKVPGIVVNGDGPNASISIRGPVTLTLPTDPLFVVNGDPVGTDFAAIHSSIDPVMVKSIRVLKGNDATLYGSRAANGVIEITLK